jgi:methyltransferase family protein
MIEAAKWVAPGDVSCILADVMADPLPAKHYDAIVSVTVLHHLALDDALRRLSGALRPGASSPPFALPRLLALPPALAAAGRVLAGSRPRNT